MEGDISLATNRLVDGVDVSEIDKSLHNIKVDDYVEVSHTGDTVETELKKYTVPAGLLGVTGSMLVFVSGHCTGNNDTKEIRLMWGSNPTPTLTIDASPSARPFTYIGEMWNEGVADDQVWHTRAWESVVCEVNNTSIGGTQNTSNPIDLKVMANVTMRLTRYSLESSGFLSSLHSVTLGTR